MIDTTRLTTVTVLHQGEHATSSEGMCMMEAAAYIADEPWSDHPVCVSPVIAAFCREWNDALPDTDRTRLLLPLLVDVIGTRTTDADDETRAWMATDWMVRVFTPSWLRAGGLPAHAQALESCAPVVDVLTARTAHPAIAAAGEAARAAARAAAGAATWAATWEAAGEAAREAWEAARAAAGEAARAAARAAGAATWEAGAAAVAARAAARAAAWEAGEAARADLAPTVVALQVSAMALARAMCAVGRVDA